MFGNFLMVVGVIGIVVSTIRLVQLLMVGCYLLYVAVTQKQPQ